MTAASRGFIAADKATGKFKPGDPVSGVDALLSVVQAPMLIQQNYDPALLEHTQIF